MNIPYLVKTLKTDKLSELVANIDLPPLDMNLAMWDAIDTGDIEIDEENDSVTVLKTVIPSSDTDMKMKVLRVIQHYSREGVNITRGRLNSYIKDPISGNGYGWHEYILAVQHLIDGELVVEEVVDVPELTKNKIGKKGKKTKVVVRPGHKFVFLGLVGNDNATWNAKAVEKWLADMEQLKVK